MITLETFKEKNLPDLLRWFSNPNNRRFQITKTIDLSGAKKLIETDNNKIVYCIKLNNEAIGYCMLKNIQTDPEIGINIDEPYWGNGYGKKVLLLLEEEAKKRNIQQIKLKVFKDNTRAINLYLHTDYLEDESEGKDDFLFFTKKIF